MNCRLTTLKDNFGVLLQKRGVGVVCSKSGSIQLKEHNIIDYNNIKIYLDYEVGEDD
jgi:hypothetical protein